MVRTAAMVVLLAGACVLWSAGTASAASGDSYIWEGVSADNGGSADWSNAGNWYCSGTGCTSTSTPISDPHSDVTLPESPDAAIYQTTLDGNVDANTLTIYNKNYGIDGTGHTLTVDGASTLDGAVNADSETVDGAVEIYDSTTLTATSVDFDSTVDKYSGTSGTPSLTVDGGATFGSNVGASTALTSLDVTGTASLPGVVDTTGTQTYGGAATLTASTTLSASSTTFYSTTDGAYGLTIDGATLFDGAVGSVSPPTSLNVSGAATIDAGSVDTTGSQIYQAGLTLDEASTLSASMVTVDDLLDGGNSDLTLDAPSTLAGGASSLGSLTVDGSLTLSGGTFTAPGAGDTFDVSGDFDATGATFAGNQGTLTLDGTSAQNLTTGGNTLAGLTIGGSSTVTAQDDLALSGILQVDSGGKLDLNGSSASVFGFAGGGTITNGGSANTLTTSPGTNDTTSFSGLLTGALALDMTGTGTQNLSGGLNDYTGGTEIDDGTLGASSDGALGDSSGGLTFDGGTLQLDGSFDSSRAVSLDFSGGTVDTNGYAGTLNGQLSGSGELTKVGSGTLTLGESSNDSYQGPVDIAGGTLAVSSGGAFGNSSGLAFDGGTLQLAGSVSVSRVITLNSGGGTVDTNGNAGTLTGPISGSGELTKAGSGTLTLSHVNSYSGGTEIDAGTLEISSDGALGDSSGGMTFDGGTLQLDASVESGRTVSLDSGGGTIDTEGGTSTFSGPISGFGGLTKAGSGELTLSGAGTYAGPTVVQAGSLDLTGSLAGPLSIQAESSATVSGTVKGAVTVNSGSLSCQGGTLKGGSVIDHGGTLSGAPSAPTKVAATAGVGKARVRFTPGHANCFPVSYAVTASPGGKQAKGSASPITVAGLHNGTAYTFKVRAINPIGASAPSSASKPVTTPAPPSIVIKAPMMGGKYSHHQRVVAKYSCQEGRGGPGIRSCVGTVSDGKPISTGTPGKHTFTVTATSKDGLKARLSISYTVK